MRISFSSSKAALFCSFRASGKNGRHLGCHNVMRNRGCAVQNKGSTLNRIGRQLQPIELAAGELAVNWQTTSAWSSECNVPYISSKMCTRQSRKVIWDMIDALFLTTVAVEPTFVAFLYHSQTHFHGLSCQFFQISLKNSKLKTTHDAFRDCRVHFFRQPFSK